MLSQRRISGSYCLTLALSLAVAGCCEEMPKNPETLANDFFCDANVLFLPFHMTCESRLSHASSFMHKVHQATLYPVDFVTTTG